MARSNCVVEVDRRSAGLKAYRLASHFWRRSIMMLRMLISLRIQAISATFSSFPLETRRP
jgi:hypothetical protein